MANKFKPKEKVYWGTKSNTGFGYFKDSLMPKRSRLPRNGGSSSVTPRYASSVIKARLAMLGLSNRISAKTIGFADLLRESHVFVTVHDWKPSPLAKELKEVASKHGFFMEF